MTTFAASMEKINVEVKPYVAKTFSGLEKELATELKFLGAENIEVIKRGVKFEGTKELLYRANYLTRTAIRILTPIAEFKVTDEQSLYDKVKAIEWSDIMSHKQTFIMNADVFHSQIDHSMFATLKAKDALVDYFRDKIRRRPSVEKENADFYINIHISQNICTVSLDSSGESLHKRGYRIGADKAPLNEVLAAGLIKLSGWKGDVDFYDPMCGSGTIVMEAAMLAMNIPAGYYREQYAFEKWADFDSDLWESIKEEHNQEFKDLNVNIVASDRSEKAVQIAKRNLHHAGLHKDIEISKAYFDSLQPKSEKGLLLFNPPYGMRLTENDIVKLYQGIGDVLKSNWNGHQAWIITSNMDAAKFIGLRPSKKIEIYNGPLEARFLCFDIYEGSKREKSSDHNRKREGLTDYRSDNRSSRGATKYQSNDYRGSRDEHSSDDRRRSDSRSYRDKDRNDSRPSRGGRYDNKDNRGSRNEHGDDRRRSDSRSYRDKDRSDSRPSRGGRYDNKDNRGSRDEHGDDRRRSDHKSYGDRDRDEKRSFKKGGGFGGRSFGGDDRKPYKRRDNEGSKSKRDSKKVTIRFKRKRLD